ncbi:MAG TPA: NADH-ubiquinone oxidoreductase-F iron-sulfur binding region domain-containing protein [Solirubrobacteraceae bacterium]|jgi:NADH:ubiquinone oxidoreductase subunit F (NADH-binding)|nr:NADH-ubiquinone oxidoreductase-F iron-sulfur binding region domain-containing protein [Solirubrobacteraceae bacterium]
MSASSPTLAEEPVHSRAPAGLPRLLAGVAAHGSVGLDEHLAIHGEPPQQRRRRRREAPLIERVEAAGLGGRGGGGFPTARKLRAVAAARRRSIVVVNAAEGEPASRKDRMLCQMTPHLMLDGAQLAAQAVGADELIVCVCESSPASVDSVAEAIEERAGRLAGAAQLRLSVVPGDYVAGQESALVNHLNGGPAVPRFTPPMPFTQGVRRRPTLISNAETFAHVALIARHGADWFRRLGMPSQPGSALITLSGPVASPGVYEIEHGASMAAVINAAGGTTARVRAALFGGYSGAWIDGSLLTGVALSDEHLAVHGAAFGAGVVALISANACPVAETVRVATWLAGEGAGQCGPCINGLDSLAATLQQMLAGTAEGNAAARIERLASLTSRRGACAHPDGAVNFILSALQTFAEDFADHARHGPCEACESPPELPLPAGAPSPRDPWNVVA